MSFTIRLLILLKGRYVGQDDYGNKYYEEKFIGNVNANRKARRWILYKGDPEASKIPPEWHAWIHYRADKPLLGTLYAWQKSHQLNQTGTAKNSQFFQQNKSSIINLSTRRKKSYESWQPKK